MISKGALSYAGRLLATNRPIRAPRWGPHDDALFRRVDTNGDGELTFEEVMANKVRAFEAGDKDKDGGLSFQEMESEVEAELGGAS